MAEDKSSDGPSKLSCRCGTTCFTFSAPSPRHSLECLCCDCLQKMEWANKKAKELGLSPAPGPLPEVPELRYFENVIEKVEGKENIKLFLLREDGRSKFVVACCCYTAMLVDHPFYLQNVVMVLPSTVVKSQKTVPFVRIYIKDWEKQRKAEGKEADVSLLPPFEGIQLFYDERDPQSGPNSREEVRKHFNNGPPSEEAKKKGKTLQQLLLEWGLEKPENLGLKG
uniref:Uncharacterized protein n=1 Tax=Paramoeba aestuarina TaxID=180227 RepID=A0A7S4PHH6_9EUKA